LVFEKFPLYEKSQEPLKSLKIFEIIYFSFLTIPFRGFVQKYPNWNSVNLFIHYGKGEEFTYNRLDDQ